MFPLHGPLQHWISDLLHETEAFTGHMDRANAPLAYYADIATPLNKWKAASYIIVTHISDLFFVRPDVTARSPPILTMTHICRADIPHVHRVRQEYRRHYRTCASVGGGRRYVGALLHVLGQSSSMQVQ